MNRPIPRSMFERLFGRRWVRRRQPEPADLGTAFGLEQTLDQPELREAGTHSDGDRPWLPGGMLRNHPR